MYISYYTDLHILLQRCTIHILLHRCTYPISQVYISYYTNVHILSTRCTLHRSGLVNIITMGRHSQCGSLVPIYFFESPKSLKPLRRTFIRSSFVLNALWGAALPQQWSNSCRQDRLERNGFERCKVRWHLQGRYQYQKLWSWRKEAYCWDNLGPYRLMRVIRDNIIL